MPRDDRRSGRPDSHYFEQRPAVVSAEEQIRVVVPGASFTMRTDRGVFSHGRLDQGTAVLLRSVPPPPPSGVGLDLGCGAGPIAVTMALRSPGLQVWATDVNERARALCAANARGAGASNVTVADSVPDDVRFDAIWSNPPIRIGKAALHDLLQAWLARLVPSGSAWLVVQRHLGADSLHRWLVDTGFPTDRAASAKGYRLLHVHPGGEGQRSAGGHETAPPTLG
jgi:16S rRNA (guanine1207-N2)-methyltransferase